MENDFRTDIRIADESMAANQLDKAYNYYSDAWETLCEDRPEHKPEEAFWLMMSWANSVFAAQDYEQCYEIMGEAYAIFKDMGLVVGNPFFHLRVGQSAYELAETDEQRFDQSGQAIDNLARALITGGIEIFAGEDDRYLTPVLDVLRPPEGFESWHDATGQGCSIDLLDTSTGHLRSVFEKKYGRPLPLDS